ncbi:MAG TPA: SpoIIE family protein phosphatase [Solirubrobacteraceae bacterium]|nr:SpoIIE family protein phosphatase [Solirubrobacteraceae bacterium]
MRSRAGLVTGVLVAVAMGAVAVALGVTLLLTHILDLRASANASLRTGAYLDATLNVERLVVDAETGLRGYVIRRDRGFLAPERSATAAMPGAAAALQRAAASDGAFQTQAAQLVSSARSYLDTYVPRVIRQVSTDPAVARSVATTALGKRLVDDTRLRSAALERQISARQAARQRANRTSANRAVTVAIVVLIALTLLTIALGGILGWLLVGRDRARQRAEELYRQTEQTARTLQESLLPAQVPEVPSCELAIRFTPAGADDLVGGDFYDVFSVGPDHWAIVVGDVCGKGAGAAAVTAMARWTLRTLADTVLPPAEVLRSLNDVMLHQAVEQRFITIIYALLEVRDAAAHVRIACAGHPPAIAVAPSGEPAAVPASGDLLAVWPDIRLHEVELTLQPGASLVFYTDGVTDQGPGVDRSPERAICKLHEDRSADALADALRDEAKRWTDTPRDDVAIVALRFLPAQAPGKTAGPAAA